MFLSSLLALSVPFNAVVAFADQALPKELLNFECFSSKPGGTFQGKPLKRTAKAVRPANHYSRDQYFEFVDFEVEAENPYGYTMQEFRITDVSVSDDLVVITGEDRHQTTLRQANRDRAVLTINLADGRANATASFSLVPASGLGRKIELLGLRCSGILD